MGSVKLEFAGLAVAVIPASKDSASILLLDAAAVKGPPHSAVLLMKDHKGLAGAPPDFTITGPSNEATLPAEYAGWFLRGVVSFAGLSSTFDRPSLDQTMDLKRVANASALVDPSGRPITATVALKNGSLRSHGVSQLFDFEYEEGGKKLRVYEAQVALKERLLCDLGEVEKSFSITFQDAQGGSREVQVSGDVRENILISNLVAGATKAEDHFKVFYALVNGTREPRILRLPSQSPVMRDEPDNPDECRLARFEF
jgi:hypothetical protein